MLYRVLSAYAAYNSEIGYCQGMNVLVGIMLLARFSEEEAFWGLVRLMRDHSVEQIFKPGLPGMRRAIQKFNELFACILPKLSKHFEKEGIESAMFLSKWFMTLYGYYFFSFIASWPRPPLTINFPSAPSFSSVLPLYLVYRVWDEFLSSSSWSMLFAIGLSLLSLFEGDRQTHLWFRHMNASVYSHKIMFSYRWPCDPTFRGYSAIYSSASTW